MSRPANRAPWMFLAALALTGLSGKSHALDLKWNWVNPEQFLGYLTCVHFQDSATGWVGGRSLYETRDMGKTWETKWTGNAGDNLSAIVFASAQKGFAVGNRGLVLLTSNGGASWSKVDIGTSRNLGKVQFINEKKGWIFGGGPDGKAGLVIFETSDGGDTWSLVGTFNYDWWEVYFVDQDLGFIAGTNGNDGSFLKTADGGRTWSNPAPGYFKGSFSATSDPVRLTSVLFLDSANGFVCTSETRYGRGYIYRTSNGGSDWVVVISPGERTGGLAYGNGTLYAFANRGRNLLRSVDGGSTWVSASNPFPFTDTDFPSTNYGFGVGGIRWLATTHNQGLTWETVPKYSLVARVKDIRYTKKALWVTSEDSVYCSGDMGRSWSVFPAEGGVLRMIDDNTGFLRQSSTALRRTDDAGKSWRVINAPFRTEGFGDFFFADGNRGWALDNEGYRVAKTTDGGNKWADLFAPPISGAMKKVWFLDSLTGWLLSKNALIKTTDGGKTWKVIKDDFNGEIIEFQALGDGNLWVNVGMRELLRYSSSQNAWTPAQVPTIYEVKAIRFTSWFQGCILDAGGNIFLTQDAGTTWQVIAIPDIDLANLALSGDSTLWIGGTVGEIAFVELPLTEAPVVIGKRPESPSMPGRFWPSYDVLGRVRKWFSAHP